jgi:ATP-dependent protease ClpP protease subunit
MQYLDSSRPAYINFRADVYERQSNELMHLVSALHNNGFTEAHLRISSPGGGVICGLELHNFLRSLPLEITTYNVGSVDSIANIVYLAGDKRNVSPNANFLMHGVSSGLNRADEKGLEEALAMLRRDQKSIAASIASRTKLTQQEIEMMFRGENIVTPDQALKMGISHEIKEPAIPQDAQVFVITNPKKQNDND